MPDFDRDRLEQLRDLAADGRRRAEGLPSDRVRALGARRHRRRMIASVAAASVAVAVVAGGAFAASGQLLSTSAPPQPANTETPSIAPSPTVETTGEAVVDEDDVDTTPPSPGGWVAEIPQDFPLDRALPQNGLEVRGPSPALRLEPADACGELVYPDGFGRSADSLFLRHGGFAEYDQQRALFLYDDAAHASAVASRVAEAMRACSDTARPTYFLAADEGSTAADESFAFWSVTPSDGEFGNRQHHIVRVGNALLYLRYHDGGIAGTASGQQSLERARRTVAAITTDMCVFAQNPCGATAEPTLPRSVLLTADQTRYFEQDDFRVTGTTHGEGEGYVSICQRDSLTSLGATDVWRRDFGVPRSDIVLRTAALQFTDDASASAAYETLGVWAEQCRDAVRSRGFTRVSPQGQWYDVEVPSGQARFRGGLIYGPVPEDEFGEMGYFDTQGLALAGDRVMVVTMVLPGFDSNWAYSERDTRQTGLSMHPQFSMLEQAAANLTD